MSDSAAVVEEEFARILTLETELLEVASTAEPGRVSVYEEQADSVVSWARVGVRLRRDDHEITALPV